MKIDLSIINFTGEEASSYRVRYARIDNTTTPVMLVAGNPTAAQFPYSIPNIDNGQYRVGITPVYADSRVCSEKTKDTAACQGIIALNAVDDGSGNIKITYTAPGAVPQVYLTVTYPNGGSYTGAYTNGANSSTILVPIPTGVYGNYLVYMQSICDPDTGFYSEATPPVTVNISNGSTITNHAITVRMINGLSYWDTKNDTCTALGSYGGGFTIANAYVKDSDWANYLLGISVTLYSDIDCSVFYKDNTIPASSTKYRVVYTTSPYPNIWQTDVNNIVSITQQNC